MKLEIFITVDCDELEQLIEQHFGKHHAWLVYGFKRMNNSVDTLNILPQQLTDQKLTLNALMNDLCSKNIIDAGCYLIKYHW